MNKASENQRSKQEVAFVTILHMECVKMTVNDVGRAESLRPVAKWAMYVSSEMSHYRLEVV